MLFCISENESKKKKEFVYDYIYEFWKETKMVNARKAIYNLPVLSVNVDVL